MYKYNKLTPQQRLESVAYLLQALSNQMWMTYDEDTDVKSE
jgi:hypothetical protein